jgi:hypothetical protein
MIVTLQGGLANQLFQYAFGISVAKARGEEVFFTRNRVDADVKRSYSLGMFRKDIRFIEKESENKFYDSGVFNPDVYTAPPDTTFIGYWQSEKWLDESLVRSKIQEPEFRIYETFRVAAEIDAVENSVFIHVRRGDYVGEKRTQEFHGSLPIEYYYNAIYHIRDSGCAKFFVFSDDPEWCREQFPKSFTIVDHNKSGDGKRVGDEGQDLWLMSLCKNAIIANSAFSWWGAWLGDEQIGRTVIAPRKWFQDPNANSADIVPDRWIKI